MIGVTWALLGAYAVLFAAWCLLGFAVAALTGFLRRRFPPT